MNREIKFRGKRVDNGEWKYGTVMVWNGCAQIIQHDFMLNNLWSVEKIRVLPKTVGQFTGLKDKDGNEIYEGDMVQHNAWDYPFEVIFHQEKARFVCKMKTGLTQYIDYENIQLVGNIHDNPELLKL